MTVLSSGWQALSCLCHSLRNPLQATCPCLGACLHPLFLIWSYPWPNTNFLLTFSINHSIRRPKGNFCCCWTNLTPGLPAFACHPPRSPGSHPDYSVPGASNLRLFQLFIWSIYAIKQISFIASPMCSHVLLHMGWESISIFVTAASIRNRISFKFSSVFLLSICQSPVMSCPIN